jgi:hypothetical protein
MKTIAAIIMAEQYKHTMAFANDFRLLIILIITRCSAASGINFGFNIETFLTNELCVFATVTTEGSKREDATCRKQ